MNHFKKSYMQARTILTGLFLCVLLTGFPPSLKAQFPAWEESPQTELRSAMDLFEKGQFSAARHAFFSLMHHPAIKNDPVLYAEAAYYEALCAIELFNQDSKDLLLSFVDRFPDNNHNNMVHFNLGLSEYQKKHYRSAIKYFEKVKISELEREEVYEYYFKKGYSHLKQEEFEEAKKHFAKIKDTQSRYSAPVNYYYAHLAYVDGDYDDALAGFEKIRENETFSSIVPHYLAHIHYQQKNWDKVIEVAPGLVKNISGKRNSEMQRMIGDAYYYKGEYEKAIPYLEKYNAAPGQRTSREDQYQLAVALFKAGSYESAIPWFERVAGQDDTLSQNAYYHLGFCYIKEGEKEFSRNAFLSAYKMDHDLNIKEDALFNYAKLAYELSYNPFNEAIRALETYIAEYPNSKRLDEAYGYLVDLFLSTRNYAGALDALKKISRLNDNLRAAYQKVAYYQGIQLYNKREYSEAIKLFHKSSEFPIERELIAEALYWTGEAYFQQKKHQQARTYYDRFLTSPGAFNLKQYQITHYNIAYTWFKQKEYQKAITDFRKFIDDPGKASKKMISDANIRTGDCYFIQRSYSQALPYYERAIRSGIIDQDYALYQRAIALGVLDRTDEKISELKKLKEEYPRSPYRDDALYELGNTWLQVQEEDKAMSTLRQVTQEYPGSSYEKQALLKIGLIQYNRHLDDQAIATLKQVVENHPGTNEAREALGTLRNIYVDLNQTEEFFEYAGGLSFANVSDREQDSISYLAAENQYMNGNREAALEGFNAYLKRFENGLYHIPANFYRAECLFALGQKDEALPAYEKVLESPGAYAETSLLRASSILFEQNKYEKALNYYKQLLQRAEYPNNLLIARTGMMRCRHYLGKDALALESAREILGSEKASDRLIVEAHLISAKSKLALGDTTGAETSFGITHRLDKGAMGAEAKYYSVYLLYADGDIEEAENAAFELINDYPAYDHWMAKAFILLADIYVRRDNLFQAKQTLQSIIDNHDGEDLVNLARDKLKTINRMEAKAMQPDTTTNQGEGEDFDDLF